LQTPQRQPVSVSTRGAECDEVSLSFELTKCLIFRRFHEKCRNFFIRRRAKYVICRYLYPKCEKLRSLHRLVAIDPRAITESAYC